MIRLGYVLSIFVLFTAACATTSSPVAVNTATAVSTATLAPKTATPASPAKEPPTPEIIALPELPHSALVDVYDPARNPAEDLQQAIVIAQHEKKRILLELGGDWCVWCKYMDNFYAAHDELLQFRAEHYILLKVNVSQENMNEEFLSQFPPAEGYPHIYILDSDGTFLHSQDTAELEDGGNSYVLDVFLAFLQKWALPS